VFADDRKALTASADGTLCVIDLATGAAVGTPLGHKDGHEGEVTDCCIFADGRRALSCGTDRTLRVWSLETHTEVRVMDEREAHTDCVNDVDLFVDGEAEFALSASDDGTLKVWDPETGQCICTLKGTEGQVKSCHVYLGETGMEALSGGADNHLRRWALTEDGQKPMGRQLNHADGSPWLAKANAQKGQIGHTGLVTGCATSEDGHLALSCSGDRSAIVWDLATGRCVRVIQEGSSLWDCCFMPGARLCLTASAFALRLWDANSGELLRTFSGHTGPVRACNILDGGTSALTCGMGGTVRVWDLSAHDNVASLGYVEGEQHKSVVKDIVIFPDGSRAVSCSYGKKGQIKMWSMKTGKLLRTFEGHTSDVNECCIFPGLPPDDLSPRGNTPQYSQGSSRPPEMLLSGSKDGTLKVWDANTGECMLTFGNAKNPIRGCGVFGNGSKVFSCSKDSTITGYDLNFDAQGRAVSAECKFVLEGHRDLVDRCCVFDGDSRMLSASWDKTCKCWNLTTGQEEFTMKDDNKIRGVAVFADDSRAVTAGSGKYLTIWDLTAQGARLERIDHQHAGTVWGLCLMPQPQRLCRNGAWVPTTCAMTYSGDGSMKVWDLTPEKECEIVHGRRAFDPGPMCICVVPGNYDLGTTPILVGGFQSIKLCDMSLLGTGASAGALWTAKSCLAPTTWADWIMSTIEEDSPHFLFIPERNTSLPTLAHKLAETSAGAVVLQKVVQIHSKARNDIVQGKPFESTDHSLRALGTIGIVSRAGTSARGSALAVAMSMASEDMTKLLLDDYVTHISSFDFARSSLCAPATLVCELTEADLMSLFKMFPNLATSFLVSLPLQATELVDIESKCDFSDATNERFVRASNLHTPPVTWGPNGILQWWDVFINDQWAGSDDRDKEKPDRLEDTAWGHSVKAARLPLSAGGFHLADAEHQFADDHEWASSVKMGDDTYEELLAKHGKGAPLLNEEALREALSAATDGKELDGALFATAWRQADVNGDGMISAMEFEHLYEYLKLKSNGTANEEMTPLLNLGEAEAEDDPDEVVRRELDELSKMLGARTGPSTNIFGQRLDDNLSEEHTQPPFSALLEMACRHSRKQGSPEIFLSPSLQAIVQHKWYDKCRALYRTSVQMYVIFLITLTLVMLKFDEWTQIEDSSGHTEQAQAVVIWVLGALCWVFMLTLLKHELHQLANEGASEYLGDPFNIIDVLMCVLTIYALCQMGIYAVWEDGPISWHPMSDDDRLVLDMFQAQSLLFCWLKLLYFMRGLDETAFLINMLVRIAADMKMFVLVLVVVLFAFSMALYLMFRHDLNAPMSAANEIIRGVPTSQFDTPAMSFIGATEMMFGNFDVATFRTVHTNAAVALIDFVMFMLILPLIMLNALIALMVSVLKPTTRAC
jgi:WD40 repeat protein